MIKLTFLILTMTLITLVVSQSASTDTSGTATTETSGTATTETSDTSTTAETSGLCSCPTSRTPVCGTNGRTYDNQCKCDCEGVDLDCEGECMCIRDREGKAFGKLFSLDFSFSKTKTTHSRPSVWRDSDIRRTSDRWGDSDWRRNSGRCGCSRHYDPVCGWNGRTYDNACIADCYDVGVKCWDECRFCDRNSDWDRDWDREDCRLCSDHWDPVCGEDGWSSGGRTF